LEQPQVASREPQSLETERDLRIVQAVLLASLITLLAYYAVPMGRNLKGMILGYGFFPRHQRHSPNGPGLSRRHLSARLGLHPADRLPGVLAIWLVALWFSPRRPELEAESRLEANYQALLAGTAGN